MPIRQGGYQSKELAEGKVTKVIVVASHETLQEALMELLAQQEEIEVCATAHDLREAHSLLNKLQTVDILVLDWPAPASKNTGMDVLRQLLEKYPRIRCLLISLYDDPFSVKQALDAGVYGYVTKAMAAEKICTATHVLAAGQRCFSPDVLDALPQSFRMEIIA